MAINDDIKNAIRSLSEKNEEVYSIVCTVDSVDISGKKCDCTPINGDAKLLNVRLMADTTKIGIFVTPSVNSQVMVTMINKYTGYVSMFSKLDEIQLNGKDKNGLVIVSDLVTKLNNLEAKVNLLVTYSQTHIHSGGTIMGSTGIGTPPVTGTLTPTTQMDLENTNVKHGTG